MIGSFSSLCLGTMKNHDRIDRYGAKGFCIVQVIRSGAGVWMSLTRLWPARL